MFKPEEYEDQECTTCSIKPAVSMGDGLFQCQECFNSLWCPKCRQAVMADAKRKDESDDEAGIKDNPEAYVKKLRAEINQLKAALTSRQ